MAYDYYSARIHDLEQMLHAAQVRIEELEEQQIEPVKGGRKMNPDYEINVPLPKGRAINIKVTTSIALSWDDVEAAWEGLQLVAENTTEPVRSCENCKHGTVFELSTRNPCYVECDCRTVCGEPLATLEKEFVKTAGTCRRYTLKED